ncbi:MAG: 23S rRNA (adenine(2503)-C(2))-methyltransferase @ tRNA (adenine(37)-C(2))-methyltransferase, partial [uncultured Nocardioidaceae bacterium]
VRALPDPSPRLRRAARPPQASPAPGGPVACGAQGAGGRARAPRLQGAAAVEPLLRPTRRRPRGDDRPAGCRPSSPGRRPAPRADDAAAHHGGRPGDDPQDPVAAVRRRSRRVGPDALPGPGHDVRVVAGRLRNGLPVLRDGPGRPAAEHVGRGDRAAGRLRRTGAGSRRGTRRTRAGLQRRVHGHGGADGQLQGGDRSRTPADRPRPGRPRHVRAWDHRLDGGPGAADAAARHRGDPGDLGAVPARARRRAAQRAGPDQHQVVGARGGRGGVELRTGDEAPGLDRVRDDAGHQRPGLASRPPRRRAEVLRRLGLGAREPDPVEPDARFEVDGVAARGGARVRAAAGGEGGADDRARHSRPGHRRRLRPARGQRL